MAPSSMRAMGLGTRKKKKAKKAAPKAKGWYVLQASLAEITGAYRPESESHKRPVFRKVSGEVRPRFFARTQTQVSQMRVPLSR